MKPIPSKNKKIGYTIPSNNLDVPINKKMSRLSTPDQIGSYIKKIVNSSEKENYETDVLEVKSVIRNQPGVRLGVRGILLNGQSDPGLVIPENINSTAVPLVGEHVVVVEREGISYFTNIVNRKNSMNENSIPGVVGDYDQTTQYGKAFLRTEVKPIKMQESSILREGRFGEAIHFDGSNNEPTIKISTQNKSTTEEPYREENPDDRNTSSIYLTSEGDDEGKKVLIQSNGIFITGRQEVKINAPNLSVNENETKLGSRDATHPVVLGDELKKYLEGLENLIELLAAALGTITPTTPGATALGTYKGSSGVTKGQLAAIKLLSNKVKTV